MVGGASLHLRLREHGVMEVSLFVYQFGMAIAVRINIGKEEPQLEGKSWKALNATEKFVLDSQSSEWRATSRFSESGSDPAYASAGLAVSSGVKPRAWARSGSLS